MTEAQRQFAAENHDLIYSFLHTSGCSISEYYDVAALGFLHAVQRYLTQPGLRRYAFATIAWQAMGREIAKDYRTGERRKKAERQYLESYRAKPFNIRQEAESGLILHDMFACASPEQIRLAQLRAQGYTLKEAAHTQGIQVKRAAGLLDDLRKKCAHIYI